MRPNLSRCDSDDLAEIVVNAVLPPLLAALAQATGDALFLDDGLRPDPSMLMLPQGGLNATQIDRARRLAVEGLQRLRDRGSDADGSPITVLDLMTFVAGHDIDADYVDLIEEEMGVGDADPRRPRWRAEGVAPDKGLRVAIIGAGMSGLLAGHRLQQAGVSFTVFEKADAVGGTWRDNRYPGCRVDIPNHVYSYSFAQRTDWPEHYSAQPVLAEYFESFAENHGLLEHVRFGAEVTTVEFDDDARTWTLSVSVDGVVEQHVADVVISAVGLLSRPRWPDIPGVHDFLGQSMHSAEWDDSIELDGRRVAVVGTGASAFQLIPHVAARAAKLTIFQRHAPWIIPSPNYLEPVHPDLRWLLENVPHYQQWYRFWLFWVYADSNLPRFVVDPTWPAADRSFSAEHDAFRQRLEDHLVAQFGDRPDLLAKVVPDYPPSAKRMLFDSGTWARVLKRDNVELITTPIDHLSEHGIVTHDGEERQFDVVIHASGFAASDYLVPMTVRGRGGVDLHDHWSHDARALLGMMIPEFPNFFCLFGPNTGLVANGSIIFMSECQMRYVMAAIKAVLENGPRATIECTTAAHDRFNQRIDAGNARMAWGAASVGSWYKNSTGRVSQVWPFTLLEYWRETAAPNTADVIVTAPTSQPVA